MKLKRLLLALRIVWTQERRGLSDILTVADGKTASYILVRSLPDYLTKDEYLYYAKLAGRIESYPYVCWVYDVCELRTARNLEELLQVVETI